MNTYVDTSVVLKLVVVDERGGDSAERLWMDSDHLLCSEIGYVEARAALAAVHRNARLSGPQWRSARSEFDRLWA